MNLALLVFADEIIPFFQELLIQKAVRLGRMN